MKATYKKTCNIPAVEPNRMIGKVVSRLSRKDMTLFIQAITGQNNLNYMNSIIIPD